MWNDVINMSRAWDKESLTGIEPMTFRTPVIHTYIIQMRISTLLILAVLRTRVTCEPCICPSWPWVSSVVSASDQGAEASILVRDSDFFFVSSLWRVDYIISHFFTKLKIYHLFIYHSRDDFDIADPSSMEDACQSCMNLVYGPAHHESLVAWAVVSTSNQCMKCLFCFKK